MEHDAGRLTGKNSPFSYQKQALRQGGQIGIDFFSAFETDKPYFGMLLQRSEDQRLLLALKLHGEIDKLLAIPAGVAFKDCTSLTSFTFDGRKEQWLSIPLVWEWRENISTLAVHCSDGDVSIML